MDICNRIKKLLVSVNEIPSKDNHDIFELLVNNEWGVAFEVLCNVIEQENLSINVEQYHEIVDIGHEMGMADTLWVRIRPTS